MDVPITHKCKVCICGEEGCKKRNKSHWKIDGTKTMWRPELQPLETVIPGHKLWPDLVEYSAEDSIAEIELWDLMTNHMTPAPLPPIVWAPEWRKEGTNEDLQADV